MSGLLISKDLMFISQVSGTARAAGLTVQTVPDATTAAARCQAGEIRCIFVDLGNAGVELAPLFAGLKALDEASRPKVLAFGSHVAVEMLAAAKAAGCDEVLPRSRFSASLPQLLQHYLG